jgi:hypothetical protein
MEAIMKLLIADIGASLHKRLKDYCYKNNLRMKDIVATAISQYLDRNK